ncbi:MAG TPA: hypothetical protein VJ784_00960 [Pyrinomonadaceae bacterium]|nr:hypothetical protein [Pyrinomonadaceae bacterium]
MTVTVDDYQRAVDDFVEGLRDSLGDDLVSIILYGSLARQECKPGQSDLLDAYVYLKNEVFSDKEKFFKAFETMVRACNRLLLTGLPYQHPFQYWSEDELEHIPALYRAHLESDALSTVLFGKDVRPQMSCTEAELAVAKVSFFEARRMGHHLTIYLRKQELTEDDCEKMLAGVKLLVKFLPGIACVSLDILTGPNQAIPSLLKALPDLDAASAQNIEAFIQKRTVTLAEAEDLREILRQTLSFIEDLHDKLLSNA